MPSAPTTIRLRYHVPPPTQITLPAVAGATQAPRVSPSNRDKHPGSVVGAAGGPRGCSSERRCLGAQASVSVAQTTSDTSAGPAAAPLATRWLGPAGCK
ncbi:hypothetical protein E2C01_004505 [Portunus trituberculatus]|uniref:Uncharacterized protein n=1 Tax=Portunus trituberculatus TaxID=210409 RepID=A0A5B7CQV4_PORTR|nr:hypothetical protein [Portunus trituberculatus]